MTKARSHYRSAWMMIATVRNHCAEIKAIATTWVVVLTDSDSRNLSFMGDFHSA